MSDANSKITVELSNRFVKEHLPYAPGEFIKVYIMTLNIASYKKPLVDEIASALGQREMDVVAALEYWQGKGLVVIKNEKETWVEITEESFKQKHASNLYTDKVYNDTLQRLFGTHILKVSEFQMIYDWTDVLGLPKEVCMMVVEYAIQRKGRKVGINYMNAVAKGWAEKGIISVEEASAEIDRYERVSSGANRVLGYIGGVGRLPSRPEIALYDKWTEEWGFTQDAILTAIKDISATANPNFNYIDTLLSNLKEKGAVTSRKISETQETDSKTRTEARELLGMIHTAITPANLQKLNAFKDMGFRYGCIKLAFAEGAKRPNVNLNYIETILKGWKQAGLTTQTKIKDFLLSQKTIMNEAYAFYKKAGINQKLNKEQMNMFLKWRDEDGFAVDMMDAVAEYAHSAKNPYTYMIKIFSVMNEKGIKTKDAFGNQREVFKQRSGEQATYIDRDYSPKDFQDDLDKIEVDGELL